jgi:hypothetical protein
MRYCPSYSGWNHIIGSNSTSKRLLQCQSSRKWGAYWGYVSFLTPRAQTKIYSGCVCFLTNAFWFAKLIPWWPTRFYIQAHQEGESNAMVPLMSIRPIPETCAWLHDNDTSTSIQEQRPLCQSQNKHTLDHWRVGPSYFLMWDVCIPSNSTASNCSEVIIKEILQTKPNRCSYMMDVDEIRDNARHLLLQNTVNDRRWYPRLSNSDVQGMISGFYSLPFHGTSGQREFRCWHLALGQNQTKTNRWSTGSW